MFHKFDLYGWYLGPVDTAGDRTTDIAPDNQATDMIEGQLHSNFTGYAWVQQVYSRPLPVPIPQTVTMRQARLALNAAGKLALIQPAIDAMPEPQHTVANIEWSSASVVERGSAFTQAMGAAIGLDAAAIDQLFIQAAQQ